MSQASSRVKSFLSNFRYFSDPALVAPELERVVLIRATERVVVQRAGESPVQFCISALAPFVDRPCGRNCHCWERILHARSRSNKWMSLKTARAFAGPMQLARQLRFRMPSG